MVSYCVLCSLLTLVVFCNGDDMLGPGKWVIINIERCEEDDMFATNIDVDTHRVNRTHVAFAFNVHLAEQFDESVSIRVDICKYVDGGCKAYQTLADNSAINFCEKFAKQNVETGFNMAKIEGWPLQVGDYSVDDYVFNLEELPEKAVYGEFIGKGFLIKNGVDFACIKVAAKFEKCDEDDDDD